MNDWLDELLRQLPTEPIPDQLVLRVRLRLEQLRRRDRRMHQVAGWLAATFGAVGTWLLISGPGGRISPITLPTPADLQAALVAASASPAQALIDLADGILSQAAGLDSWFLLAISLLGVPAMYGASLLLSSETAQRGVTS